MSREQSDLMMIARAVVQTFTLTCQLCSYESSTDSPTKTDSVNLFFRAGWRRDEDERGALLLCPQCAALPGPSGRREGAESSDTPPAPDPAELPLLMPAAKTKGETYRGVRL